MINSTNEAIFELHLDIRLYPNPVKSNKLNVSFDSNENGVVVVKVYDLMGACISQHKAFVGNGQQALSIDIAALSSGNYIIQLDNGKRKGVAKFIVQ